MSDWIEWSGGKMPVPGETEVSIRAEFVDGRGEYLRHTPDQAGWFDHLGWWEGKEARGDRIRITHYRIVDASEIYGDEP